MRRWILLVWLGLVTAAGADLEDLLAWQRKGDSGAYVSSGFHDWRGVSRYRRQPGLHAGYDIAMLAGSAVRTPWPGTVVAVTPWYGSEVGVSVSLENGWEVTFGHITSSVRVGQKVACGDIVGRVVVDHVDVKARDRGGALIDFAAHRIRVVQGPVTDPEVPISSLSVEESRKQEAAYQEYRKLLAMLAEDEAKLRLGLVAARAVRERRARLDALRPLAWSYARRAGTGLPKKDALEEKGSTEARPVADLLVGHPAVDDRRQP